MCSSVSESGDASIVCTLFAVLDMCDRIPRSSVSSNSGGRAVGVPPPTVSLESGVSAGIHSISRATAAMYRSISCRIIPVRTA